MAYQIKAPNLQGLLSTYGQLQSSNAYKARLKMAEMAEERSRRSGMLRTVGTIGGAIIGAIYGGPGGMAVGAQVGNTAGGLISAAEGNERVNAAEVAQSASSYADYSYRNKQMGIQAEERAQQQAEREQRMNITAENQKMRETVFLQGQTDREIELAEKQAEQNVGKIKVDKVAEEAIASILNGRDPSELSESEARKIKLINTIRDQRNIKAQNKVAAIIGQVPDIRYKTSTINAGGEKYNIITDRVTEKQTMDRIKPETSGKGAGSKYDITDLSTRWDRAKRDLGKMANDKAIITSVKNSIELDEVNATPEQLAEYKKQKIELNKRRLKISLNEDIAELQQAAQQNPEAAYERIKEDKDYLISQAASVGMEKQVSGDIQKIVTDIERQRLEKAKKIKTAEIKKKKEEDEMAKDLAAKLTSSGYLYTEKRGRSLL